LDGCRGLSLLKTGNGVSIGSASGSSSNGVVARRGWISCSEKMTSNVSFSCLKHLCLKHERATFLVLKTRVQSDVHDKRRSVQSPEMFETDSELKHKL
jgi:hypothetical protein